LENVFFQKPMIVYANNSYPQYLNKYSLTAGHTHRELKGDVRLLRLPWTFSKVNHQLL